MNIPSRFTFLGLLLAVSFGQPMPANAGLTTITRGDASAMSAILVISAPYFVSLALGHSAMAGSEALDHASNKASAGPLPPMRVKSVEKTTDGGCEVQLQDPEKADNTALLRWPAREDDPAAGFRVGETVTFQPSPAGAGWTVQSPQGQALAFVPTAVSAAQNSSKTW
ncbi:hypothetical protein VC218_20515 [Xanthomonas nasturtii]|uniref:hypothetical protein n=1 Tax=Xanthomonas nasturtii TaxID=1843581 RepID=UPI002B22BEEE|nr:hypothetical protein [Xanthomonas nasturtii]MEA9581184.1 hypothetical protein [Xanthomonas nasturtii]